MRPDCGSMADASSESSAIQQDPSSLPAGAAAAQSSCESAPAASTAASALATDPRVAAASRGAPATYAPAPQPGAGSAAAGPIHPQASAAGGMPPPAAAQLPVVDLIGLRFSLQHLRLVGYGLMAVWLTEIINLLSSPGVGEIGSRLHYISQFLDLSPILLVSIGLIAFQGGLRRSGAELLLLPSLLALLPLLCALHFFLAPVSVANAITLVQKQTQIGTDQIERIDRQIDRAASILRESDSIDGLLNGLQRIPGLQVRVPPQASVNEARREVRLSLERERDRLRQRIAGNLSSSRDAFLRRAITNSLLALLVGCLLWGLHHGAMREMAQAIPFLDWVLLHGDNQQNPEALQQLLRFQRACISLGFFTLLERSLRLVRRMVRRPSQRDLEEEEARRLQERQAAAPPQPPRPPGPPRRSGIRSANPSRRWTLELPSLPFLPARLPRPAAPTASGPDAPEWAGAQAPSDPAASAAPGERNQARPPMPIGSGSAAPAGPTAAEALRSGAISDDDPQASDPLLDWMRQQHDADQQRAQRRQLRDLQRYRARTRHLHIEGTEPIEAEIPGDAGAAGYTAAREQELAQVLPPAPLTARQRRRLERDHQRARQALQRMAFSEEMVDLHPDEQALQAELSQLEFERESLRARSNRPRGIRAVWGWFLSHL